MTQDFKNLLYIFQCSVHNKDIDRINDANYEKICELALEQSILPIIYRSYVSLLREEDSDKAKKFTEKYEKYVIQSVYNNIQKKEIIKCILAECREIGIECCLLKGWLFADLYAEPEYRISGDVDLYVDKNNEDLMIDILQKYGFKCKKALTTEYHGECISEVVGLLELHTSLYDDYCEKIWFRNLNTIIEDKIRVTTKDKHEYSTFGVTDSMIFNSLHFIKHFLSGGVGIRQLMDIMLFIKYNKTKIDYNRFKQLMRLLKFDMLFDVFSEISIRYLGFEKEELLFLNDEKLSDDSVEKVINTIERGGVFGKNERELHDFNRIYTAYILDEENHTYSDYIKSTIKNNGLFRYIFLDRDRLSDKYMYAKRNGFLLPIAWVHRAVAGFFYTKKVNKARLNNVQIEKIRLLKELKII